MLGLSLPEIIFLAILALVVIGPKQLPEVARTLGRLLNELRRASNSFSEELRAQVKIDPIRLEDKPEQKAHKPNEGGNYAPSEPFAKDEAIQEVKEEAKPADSSETKKS
ncbi:MAG: twin-arginine translocase TatA/TatE family subunit [Bdellovibrionales bacterium]|nr:twin-arginine translocase TatA/TatE family subunit [Bdellovibrionales bacterium]